MEARLDPRYNYFGIRFFNAFWKDVCACCIHPPDAAFLDDRQHQWYDADDNPIPTPEGKDGHRIAIFWRMDEPEDRVPTRPRLYAILAAFAHLYSMSVSRDDSLQMVMVRYTETPCMGSDVPPANFRLWSTSLRFMEDSCRPVWISGEEFEKQELPPPAAPCADADCDEARSRWCRLVYRHLDCLLSAVNSAESYVMLKSTLDEWVSYTGQLRGGDDAAMPERIEATHERLDRLVFKPWYPEALRLMPTLNENGLLGIALPSIGRMALLDYRPEDGRRFCYEELKSPAPWQRGRLRLAGAGETPLPYDARTHLHLLPVPCEHENDSVWIEGVRVKGCCRFKEEWLWD